MKNFLYFQKHMQAGTINCESTWLGLIGSLQTKPLSCPTPHSIDTQLPAQLIYDYLYSTNPPLCKRVKGGGISL